jgi:hypothetical protein
MTLFGADETYERLTSLRQGVARMNDTGKLEALLKREASLRTAISAEKVRQQKRKEKEQARMFSILGEALTRHAERVPDFRRRLIEALQSAELRDSDHIFLVSRGWLSSDLMANQKQSPESEALTAALKTLGPVNRSF